LGAIISPQFFDIGKFILATFAALFLGALGLGLTTATCYTRIKFRSSSLKREDRIKLLSEAVKNGEVPTEVAEKAKKYIDNLLDKLPY